MDVVISKASDLLLSEHVLALHSGTSISSSMASISSSTSNVANQLLRDSLKLQPGESVDHLPHFLFRKFIAYAQKYVNPILSDDSRIVIKNFYLNLRKKVKYGGSTPVTTKQLMSLIKLTQARAKIELRQETTKEDALNTIEIVQHSLIDVFTDNAGILDISRSQNSSGMTSKNQAVRLLRLLQQRFDLQNQSTFTESEIKQLAQNIGLTDRVKFLNALEALNIQGFLLKKGGSRYQLVGGTS